MPHANLLALLAKEGRLARKGGPKFKLNAHSQDRIIRAIQLGAPISMAVKAAGITYQTHLNWAERGRAAPGSKFGAYLAAIEEAQGARGLKWLAIIEKSINTGDVASAKWKLEKCEAADFGSKVEQKVTMDAKVVVKASELKSLSPEQLNALASWDSGDDDEDE